MAPLVVHVMNTADIKEGLKVGSVRMGQQGRLYDGHKVAEVAETN